MEQVEMDAAARKLLADAFGASAGALEEELSLGQHLWTGDNGTRAYGRQDGPDGVLTLVRTDGSRSEYRSVRVHLDALR